MLHNIDKTRCFATSTHTRIMKPPPPCLMGAGGLPLHNLPIPNISLMSLPHDITKYVKLVMTKYITVDVTWDYGHLRLNTLFFQLNCLLRKITLSYLLSLSSFIVFSSSWYYLFIFPIHLVFFLPFYPYLSLLHLIIFISLLSLLSVSFLYLFLFLLTHGSPSSLFLHFNHQYPFSISMSFIFNLVWFFQ